MSDSSSSRIRRSKGPSGTLTKSTLRKKALKFLLQDFQGRCAYSQRHVERAGGERQMEIDHFNPWLKSSALHAYSNLMLSTRHCNNKKDKFWPTKQEERAGVRFLNPTKEVDYGVHIFEDPETNELVGITPAGRYQIDILDLNHETFVRERSERAEFIRIVSETPALFSGELRQLHEIMQFITKIMKTFIPAIPAPPAGSY